MTDDKIIIDSYQTFFGSESIYGLDCGYDSVKLDFSNCLYSIPCTKGIAAKSIL